MAQLHCAQLDWRALTSYRQPKTHMKKGLFLTQLNPTTCTATRTQGCRRVGTILAGVAAGILVKLQSHKVGATNVCEA